MDVACLYIDSLKNKAKEKKKKKKTESKKERTRKPRDRGKISVNTSFFKGKYFFIKTLLEFFFICF
jgi:hypothetical protein